MNDIDDDQPVGTILTRREALRAAAIAGASLILGSGNASGPKAKLHLIATPAVEEGPFFVDEHLHKKDLRTGTSRESVVKGSPLIVRITVYELRGEHSKPLQGAHVDVWHADAAGSYSDEAPSPVQAENTKGQQWLRGYQIADSNGKVEFQTIHPGWYHSRTPHIHVKIRRFDTKSNKTHEFNTQLFFDEATNDATFENPPYNDSGQRRVRNLWDGLYSVKQADGTMVGSHLHLQIDQSIQPAVAHFAIGLKLD